MMFAVAVTAARQSRRGTQTVLYPFLLEAFNKDEATGIGHRVLNHILPVQDWPLSRVVAVESFQLDPYKLVEQQMPLARIPC